MKFPKDILVIDFEGLDEPVQVGAVLLDRETLEEKKSIRSYIWSDLKGEVKGVSGISQETLIDAPSQQEVGRTFHETFGSDVLLACWVANADLKNLEKILGAAGIPLFPTFDYHVIDIWPAAYLYLLRRGYHGGVRSDEIFEEYGIPNRGEHDALEDARIAAAILRRISIE